jgi:hypothetical protein
VILRAAVVDGYNLDEDREGYFMSVGGIVVLPEAETDDVVDSYLDEYS